MQGFVRFAFCILLARTHLLKEHDFARYSAKYRPRDYRDVGNGQFSQGLNERIITLLTRQDVKQSWLWLYNPDPLPSSADALPSAAYYAALLGLDAILAHVLSLPTAAAYINPQEGTFSNALIAAAAEKQESIVRILLDKGADVNAQGEHFRNALHAASWKGCQSMVKLLLDRGIDVNAQGGYFGTALVAASVEGQHPSIVKILLDSGADVNAQVPYFGSALQAALGHKDIVQLLLDAGAATT